MSYRLERLRRFFEELRRRRVYRVAAVYTVVSWVAIQIAATSLPYLMDRPDWLVRAIIILALMGFPVALVLGWIFDLTPQGVRRTDGQPGDSAGAEAAAARRAVPGEVAPRSPFMAFVTLSLAAVAVGFALWMVRTGPGSGPVLRPPMEQGHLPVGNTTPPNGRMEPAAGELAQSGDTTAQHGKRHTPARPTVPRPPGAGTDTATPPVEQGLEGAGPDTTDGPLPATPPGGRDVDSILREIGAAVSGLKSGGIAQTEGPVPERMRRIVVFPFRVTGVNADAKWSDIVADSLTAALDDAGFGTVAPDTIRQAVDRAGPDDGGRGTSAKLALSFGADAFVTGVVVPQGTSLVLEVMLSAVDKPDIMRHATAIVPTEGLKNALARVVTQLTQPADTTSP